MNRKSENIDLWIVRILVIFFFLAILAFSDSDSKSQIDKNPVSIVQIDKNDNCAIFVNSLSIPGYNISLVSCELINIKKCDSKLGVWISNNLINRQLKREELNFLAYKSKLFNAYIIPLKLSSKEDSALIS